MTARRLPILLLAFVAAVGLLGAPVGPTAPTEVHAAAAPLRFTSDARYDVQPKQRRVRVIVDLRMTNPSKDTPTTAYYYDHAFVQVMAGASSFKVDGPGSPRVRVVSRRKQDVQLRIDFGRRLTSGKSADYRLTFYLKDPGGSATRDLRVGDSLVSFPVWAFATRATPGSTVTVVFPKGFDVEVEAGKIAAPTTEEDGRTIFRTGKLAKPLEFFAYLVADRPGAYRDDTVATDVLGAPVQVNVRAWQDDQPWAKRISGLLDAGLPALGTRIGLDWPEYSQPLDGPGSREPHDRWLRRVVRPECRQGRDRVLRRRLRRAPRGGTRLVQRLAPGRPLGERGVRVVLRHGRRRRHRQEDPRRRAHRRAREVPDPAERLGTGRLRGRRARRTTHTPQRWPSPGPSRNGPATRASRPCGGTRRAASGPINRPAVAPRRRSRPRRIGAACWTCSRSGRTPRTTTCGERGWRATPTCRCSTRGPRRASATT